METVTLGKQKMDPITLSTAKVYHVLLNSEQVDDCGGNKCYGSQVFEFYGLECQVSAQWRSCKLTL